MMNSRVSESFYKILIICELYAFFLHRVYRFVMSKVCRFVKGVQICDTRFDVVKMPKFMSDAQIEKRCTDL